MEANFYSKASNTVLQFVSQNMQSALKWFLPNTPVWPSLTLEKVQTLPADPRLKMLLGVPGFLKMSSPDLKLS